MVMAPTPKPRTVVVEPLVPKVMSCCLPSALKRSSFELP
jgi:hypothetical protein